MGPAADLGFGAVMRAAQAKLLGALPEGLRGSAARVHSRFHLDAHGWIGAAEQPAFLSHVADAVWGQRVITIHYQSWKAEKPRRVEPLGIVLKGSAWYLVGRTDDNARTYRVSRILSLLVLNETFERGEEFNLAAFWNDTTERLEAELHPNLATVRLSPQGMKLLEAVSLPYVRARLTRHDDVDAEGWRTATVPVGSLQQAAAEFLRLGADVVVIEPSALRSEMERAVARMAHLYGSPASR